MIGPRRTCATLAASAAMSVIPDTMSARRSPAIRSTSRAETGFPVVTIVRNNACRGAGFPGPGGSAPLPG